MRRNDIRFSGQAATIEHHSARGRITRNADNFTRGSQLLSHQYQMTWAGIKIPLWIWVGTFVVLFNIFVWLGLDDHEFQLDLMRLYSTLWTWVGADKYHLINLTLPNGSVAHVPMGYVPYHPAVAAAWAKTLRIIWAGLVVATIVAAPIIMWFITFANKRGSDILKERHERGAMLVERPVLLREIKAHNNDQFENECRSSATPRNPAMVAQLSLPDRVELGIHTPYSIAGIPYPWRLEQSHTMMIGTTGTGKTTQLRSLVTQLRKRKHRAVIFDLTGAFMEAFYNPETDIVLNPMDQRCAPWTLFDECRNYADFVSAAAALIPSHPDDKEPFWQNAARMLFIEMCIKLQEAGETTNAAIAHHLMQADLKSIHAKLEDTVAAPLTTEKAARMAESIRSVLNVNGQAIRFMPDPVPGGPPAFSIRNWISTQHRDGSIMFITGSYNDLEMTRGLFTLWMDLAVNNLMRLPKTRDLRTWYLFDEVHALHALPAIEHGLQSARNYGGAFVLGIHSFDKLVATYGLQNATALTGLARTKLILATADRTTAEKCSEFIGSREVRQMDEAYSYGYNNTRDASTLTPRKAIEPLVIPDDINNLPSLHGFVKFPDGFPATRIELRWKNYPEVAVGFAPRPEFKPTEYVSPDDRRRRNNRAEEGGEGGTEHTPNRPLNGAEPVMERPEPQRVRSEAEQAASAIEIIQAQPIVQQPGTAPATPGEPASIVDGKSATTPTQPSGNTPVAPGVRGGIDASLGGMGKSAIGARSGSDMSDQSRSDGTAKGAARGGQTPGEDRQEDQVIRELRDGIALDPNAHHHRGHDHDHGLDDGYGMGD
ncbi:type IV secretion system DNA-binding domain-containing protein [Sphingomonas sp. 1P08PE]|jgi:type IV conjugative transfer system coupling protein TraD|uniref:type IV secretion system DNA-binding domain-containing protein n=1 Tax=Sphingomonas sp. 1P08PE TaxID=554122 RepID=UPI0039A34FB2